MFSQDRIACSLSPKPAQKICFIVFFAVCFPFVSLAQQDDFGDNSADPVKLFERAQNAHARGDLVRALELYEEAIKVRPDFPEAEFQRGNVLVSLGRFSEAEPAFRHVIEQRKDWSLAYSALGALLIRQGREPEADELLCQALKLDGQNNLALRLLADLRFRGGDAKEALALATRATKANDAPPSVWLVRAMAERALGARSDARASLARMLQVEPENVAALLERAELYSQESDYQHAIEDLKTAERIKPGDKQILARLALAYERAGNPNEARRAAEAAQIVNPQNSLSDGTIKVIGTPEEIESANSEEPVKARKALEALLAKNPGNAMLMAKLGASYRTDDPARSLELYRRASGIQPKNPDYAVGYAAALVQVHRFADAVPILQRVVALAPDNYAAHANLATALYRLKQYQEALAEYDWLLKTKPDLVVVYYFIATANDFLGQYPEALSAYERFLAHADVKTNQLEIDKVKLRLPTLRRQIQLGQGVKKKKVN
jgi:protein O-GlcNAc transferase